MNSVTKAIIFGIFSITFLALVYFAVSWWMYLLYACIAYGVAEVMN